MTRVKQGDVDAVVELPAGDAKAPVVVLLQEYWGLDENMSLQAKHWASHGFVVIMPDLFHGKVTKDAAEAGSWLKAFDFAKGFGEIQACVEYGRKHERST